MRQPLRHPPVEGQLDHALLIDELAERAVLCPDQLGIRLDGDLFSELSDLHDDRQIRGLIHGEGDASLDEPGKARPLDAQLVAAHRQSRKQERAAFISGGSLRESGVHIAHDDL